MHCDNICFNEVDNILVPWSKPVWKHHLHIHTQTHVYTLVHLCVLNIDVTRMLYFSIGSNCSAPSSGPELSPQAPKPELSPQAPKPEVRPLVSCVSEVLAPPLVGGYSRRFILIGV